jgi:hypothetical protein
VILGAPSLQAAGHCQTLTNRPLRRGIPGNIQRSRRVLHDIHVVRASCHSLGTPARFALSLGFCLDVNVARAAAPTLVGES